MLHPQHPVTDITLPRRFAANWAVDNDATVVFPRRRQVSTITLRLTDEEVQELFDDATAYATDTSRPDDARRSAESTLRHLRAHYAATGRTAA